MQYIDDIELKKNDYERKISIDNFNKNIVYNI